MSKKDIKFMHKLAVPHIRKRDGETVTHSMVIALTTEEALLISQYFADRKESTAPTVSLIRAFLLQQALSAVDETTLLESMAAVYLKKRLAYDLSTKDYCRAIDFIKNPPQPKAEIKPPAKPERRVYIPEPRRR